MVFGFLIIDFEIGKIKDFLEEIKYDIEFVGI